MFFLNKHEPRYMIIWRSLKIEKSPVLSLYANGKTTGFVLESGEEMSYAVPIFEGFCLPFGIMKMDFGEKDLTNHLMKLLIDEKYSNIKPENFETINRIKEKNCLVAYDFDVSLKGLSDFRELGLTHEIDEEYMK